MLPVANSRLIKRRPNWRHTSNTIVIIPNLLALPTRRGFSFAHLRARLAMKTLSKERRAAIAEAV